MGWRDWIRNKIGRKETIVEKAPTPTKQYSKPIGPQKPDSSNQQSYQGPVQPTTDEKTFRDTGRSTPKKSGGSYQGPVRPSTDEEEFRETGKSTPKSAVNEAQKLEPQNSTNNIDQPQQLGSPVIKRQEAIDRGYQPTDDSQAFTMSQEAFAPKSKWQTVKDVLYKVAYPLDTSTTVWRGGRAIPREQYGELSSAQQRAMFFTPENILLFATVPQIKDPVTVKFTGIKQTTDGKETITGIKYRASTGEKGSAVGTTKVTGGSGRVQTTDTSFIGSSYRGKYYDGVSGQLVNKNQQFFVGKQGGVFIKEGNQFVQVGGGKVYTLGGGKIDAYGFGGVDVGVTKGALTRVGGASGSYKGEVISQGLIVDINKIGSQGAGSTVSIGTGGSTITTGLSQQTIARLATQQTVRASIQPVQSFGTMIAPQLSSTVGAVQSRSGGTITKSKSITPITFVLPQSDISQQIAPTVKAVETSVVIPTVVQVPSSSSRGRGRTTTIPTVTPAVTPNVTTTPAITPAIVPAVTLTPATTTGGGFGGFPTTTTPTNIKFPKLPLFKLGYPKSSFGSNNVPSKQTFRYTPDYTSLITGRKGKEGKSIFGTEKYAGFESRPITNSWGKMLGSALGIFKKKKKKGGKK